MIMLENQNTIEFQKSKVERLEKLILTLPRTAPSFELGTLQHAMSKALRRLERMTEALKVRETKVEVEKVDESKRLTPDQKEAKRKDYEKRRDQAQKPVSK